MSVEILEKKDIEPILMRMKEYEAKLDLVLHLLSRSEDRLLDTDEIVQRLGISSKTFYNRASDGDFPFAVKMGRHWKAKESELNEYLQTISTP